jgi:hypothetical protein
MTFCLEFPTSILLQVGKSRVTFPDEHQDVARKSAGQIEGGGGLYLNNE